MKNSFLPVLLLLISFISNAQPVVVADTPFWQEYHEAYPVSKESQGNEVRSIAVDDEQNVWIATVDGIFLKNENDPSWRPVLSEKDRGPAFAVVADSFSRVWMGTWKGVFVRNKKKLQHIGGTEGPVSAICDAKNGVYAAGPGGVWFYDGKTFKKKNYKIARSVRSIVADERGGLWVATDVGLYYCTDDTTHYYYNTYVLISAYVKGLAFDQERKLWAAGLGGVSVLNNDKKERFIRPEEGCPSIYVNCVKRSTEGIMWVGTQVGVVRYAKGQKPSLLFSRRWLLSDDVRDIAFDRNGNAWVATSRGVSAIKRRKMTMAAKQDYFYDVLMKRHVREPWIVGLCRLKTPGDINSWEPEDDDNDGEFTGNYLAMESFRYAATKSEDAKIKTKKAFEFLKGLREVTGKGGSFARTIVPADWINRVHDPNMTYTEKMLADELVKEPRFKPVEVRWHKTPDGKWYWKGDASSDEWCGHMLGYFFYYELVADKQEKKKIAHHVGLLLDHLIANNFNMVDVDGKHTRWSVWSPDKLNRDPEWAPDRNQNSMELLTFLKLAYYMTGDQKYQQHYLRLINKEHYLENMKGVLNQNPAWFIYFDVTLQSYLYPILLHCEKDPTLLAFYQDHLERWMSKRIGDKNPLINFLYCYATGKKVELKSSVEFLIDTPLDLIDWTMDHSKREDIKLVRAPVLDDLQVSELPPPSIRSVVRWDKNPWVAINGYPDKEREPVFWLLPYWMGRYLKMIE